MCLYIYNKYIENLPIRKVSISLGKLENNISKQLTIFDEYNKDDVMITIDKINNKLGNNSILKASSLLKHSTIKERNKKLGGHNKE